MLLRYPSQIEDRTSALRQVGQLINFRRYGQNDVIPSWLFPFEPRATSHSKANAMQDERFLQAQIPAHQE